MATLLALTSILVACGDEDNGDSDGGDFDPQQVVTEAADKLAATNTFHFVLDHENGGTAIVLDLTMNKAEGDIVRPEQMRADIEASLGMASAEVTLIGIGQDTWISNPFNPDEFEPLPDYTPGEILNLEAVPEVMRAIESPQANGTASVGGTDTYRVTADIDSGELAPIVPLAAEPGQQVEIEIWVGQEDDLVRRIAIRGPLNPNESAGITRTLDLSKFDEAVTIEPPE
jgi:lipoprotein LprG